MWGLGRIADQPCMADEILTVLERVQRKEIAPRTGKLEIREILRRKA
jgi:hypothetical protein